MNYDKATLFTAVATLVVMVVFGITTFIFQLLDFVVKIK